VNDESHPLTPGGRVLIALDAFYVVYQAELPALTYEQVRTIYKRLAFYTHEVDDDASRKPPASGPSS
jgi:hypothetical protein